MPARKQPPALPTEAARPIIGTLRERSLHMALKQDLALPGDRFEVRAGGHVIDIVRENPDDPEHPLLIEIQTGSFSHMRAKVRGLLDAGHRVHVVYPIAAERWVVRVDADGVVKSRRKSPRRGQPADLFYELVSFPEVFRTAPGRITLEVVFTHEEQVLHHDGRGGWRRKGWSVADRRLLRIVERRLFVCPADFAAFVPAALAASFTAAELASALGCDRGLAYKVVYSLRAMGVLVSGPKRGRSGTWARADGPGQQRIREADD
jgi:hypothetical protein